MVMATGLPPRTESEHLTPRHARLDVAHLSDDEEHIIGRGSVTPEGDELTRLRVVLGVLLGVKPRVALGSNGAQWVSYALTHPRVETREALRPRALRLVTLLASTREGRALLRGKDAGHATLGGRSYLPDPPRVPPRPVREPEVDDPDAAGAWCWPEGQTLSPAAHRAWSSLVASSKEARARGEGDAAAASRAPPTHVHCPACGDHAGALEALRSQCAESWGRAAQRGCRDWWRPRYRRASRRRSSWSVEGTEVRVIPSDDPRVGVRGQRGLFTTRRWMPGETVAPYAAYVVTGEEFDAALCASRAPLRRRLDHQRYTVAAARRIRVPPPSEGGKEEGGEDTPLLFCALDERWSNSTKCINDPTVAPDADHGGGSATTGAANCQIVESADPIVADWPRLHVVVAREVAPGEELRMAYGAEYWAHESCLARAAEDIETRVGE